MAGEVEVDRELLARVRSGDDAAFGELFSRHADAVRRFASRHVRDHVEADDLTAEAFFRVLQAIRRGTGPTDHVRTYLLTVARRVAWEWSGRRRDVPVEDEELDRRVEPFPDLTAARAEHTLISRAFTSLPERWRSVLWQVEVEGARPAAVATNFGLSPNAMAALARRAREGLRAAYLQAHLSDDVGPRSCSSVLAKLGTYTAGGVQGAELRKIRTHLRACAKCNALHAELVEVCSTLRAHAAHLAVPVVAASFAAPVLFGKAAWLSGRVKLVLAGAASAVAVGLFGMLAGQYTGAPGPGLVQIGPDGGHLEDVVAVADPSTIGTPETAAEPVPAATGRPGGPVRPAVATTTTAARKPRSEVAAAPATATTPRRDDRHGRVLADPGQTTTTTSDRRDIAAAPGTTVVTSGASSEEPSTPPSAIAPTETGTPTGTPPEPEPEVSVPETPTPTAPPMSVE
ncbi:hypothetical protein GCM10022243_28600 [Saccharothrix violaceirubra]|uniref:RNA polymerase sigma factor (Sigma-70 family) n=1 Tax=Saccharothrix violaceirubra TaxID=413306 RepID=A0A7W7WZ84_9PSEU|nr:sigma-70 family RNA polymerase sigma factor [Saccharothrix violaceirubra]MBB4969215.1 RNA polymerase sigma factor (sigma-70 family) [Saccharothrix violaceirubra]